MDNIVLCGVLDKEGSTNIPLAEAFIDAGYNLIPINYRTLISNYGEEYFNKTIIEICKEYKPVLTIFSKINSTNPEIVSECSKYGKTLYWFMDNIMVAEGIKAEEYVKRADFASATSSEVVEYFKQYNENSIQIIEGYDYKVFYPEELDKDIDILFFGSATDKRVEYIKKLDDELEGFEIAVVGSGWGNDSVFNNGLRQLINRSKIVLNFVHSNIFSDRVVTTLGSGSLMLSEYCSDIEKYFKIGEHLLTFENFDELIQNVNCVIEDDDLRHRISRDGYEHTKQFYHWFNIAAVIMKITGNLYGYNTR